MLQIWQGAEVNLNSGPLHVEVGKDSQTQQFEFLTMTMRTSLFAPNYYEQMVFISSHLNNRCRCHCEHS